MRERIPTLSWPPLRAEAACSPAARYDCSAVLNQAPCATLSPVRRWLTPLAFLCLLAWASAALAATSPLAGVYQTVITGQKGQAAVLNGTWLISFAPNGAYAVVKEPSSSTLLIGGSSSVAGTTIVFHDKTGPLACVASGRYSWKLIGKTLKLTKLTDTCAGRVLVLSSATYARVR